MFDINGGEAIILVLVALVVLGPERLPHYAQQLAKLVRRARTFALGARDQVRAELGPEFDDVDWAKLDPRRYNPRRIVRDALAEAWEDEPAQPVSVTKPARAQRAVGEAAPFDTEAT